MGYEFVVKNGLLVQAGPSKITGSLQVTQGITGSFTGSLVGSLIGTASVAVSASYAPFNTGPFLNTGSIAQNIEDAWNISNPAGLTLDITDKFVNIVGGLTATTSITAARFTGSLYGTASWATQTISASYLSGSYGIVTQLTASNGLLVGTTIYKDESISVAGATSTLSMSCGGTGVARTAIELHGGNGSGYITMSLGGQVALTINGNGYVFIPSGLISNATTATTAGTTTYALFASQSAVATSSLFASSSFYASSSTVSVTTAYASASNASLFSSQSAVSTSSLFASRSLTANSAQYASSSFYASSSTVSVTTAYASASNASLFASQSAIATSSLFASQSISASYLSGSRAITAGEKFLPFYTNFGNSTCNFDYYPNVAAYASVNFLTGSIVITTPIGRLSNTMFVIRVHGYDYSAAKLINTYFVGYTYNGQVSELDSQSGSLINYSMVDLGSDYLPKRIGITSGSNGNVAISIGDSGSLVYYRRLSVDYWNTYGTGDGFGSWNITNISESNYGMTGSYLLTSNGIPKAIDADTATSASYTLTSSFANRSITSSYTTGSRSEIRILSSSFVTGLGEGNLMIGSGSAGSPILVSLVGVTNVSGAAAGGGIKIVGGSNSYGGGGNQPGGNVTIDGGLGEGYYGNVLIGSINTGSKVGIGTALPQTQLHIENLNTGNRELLRFSHENAYGGGSRISWWAANNVTEINRIANDLTTEDVISGQLKFSTYVNGIGLRETFRLKGNGNALIPSGSLGVGTQYPATPLQVVGHATLGVSGSGITMGDFGILNIGHTGDNYSAITVGDAAGAASGTGLYLRSGGTISAISTAGSALMFCFGGPGTTERVRMEAGGNVGIGMTPTKKLSVNGGVNVTGSVDITGTLTAAIKSFVINHPTKEGYRLQYGSVESPYHGVQLSGRNKVVGQTCKVTLPDYFHALVSEEGVNVQLTNIKHSTVLFVDEVNLKENYFSVATTEVFKKEREFFWMLTAVRKDVPNLIVES